MLRLDAHSRSEDLVRAARDESAPHRRGDGSGAESPACLSAALAIATTLLFIGCSDSPTDIDGNVTGAMSFTYTGGGGGSYSATGDVTLPSLNSTSPAALLSTWATGWKDNSNNSTWVFSNLPTTTGRSNLANIVVSRQTTGSVTMDGLCGPSAPSCNSIGFMIGWNPSDRTFTHSCVLTMGTITVSSISNTNVRGSFSGSGLCVTAALASTAFTVTNGSFNVPLLEGVPTFGG